MMNLRHSVRLWVLLVLTALTAPVQADTVLTFNVTSHTEPAKGQQKVDKTPIKPTDETYALTVTLAADYMRIDKPAETMIYDFAHARRYELKNADHTYEESSLYVDIGFRDYEFRNRMMLGKALAAGGVKDNPMAPALSENLMSLSDEQNHTLIETRSTTSDTIYSWDKHPLVMVSQKVRELPATTLAAYVRFLRYGVGGHPKILAAIGQGRGVPERLTVVLTNIGTDTRVLSLQSIDERADAPFTLEGFTLSTPDRQPFTTLKILGPHATADLDAHVSTVRHERDAAFASGKALDALLANFIALLSTGDGEEATAWISQHHDQISADADAQRFMRSLEPKDEASAKQAADTLASLGQSPSPHSYVLKIFEANVRTSLHQAEEAEHLFLAALAQDPTITGAWTDLGGLYYDSYDPTAAWACWDAARRLRPQHPMLKKIEALEQHLRTDHPEFF